MFVLPILPAELPVELQPDPQRVVAVLRPLTHEGLAELIEAHPLTAEGRFSQPAGPWAVRRHLVRIDGLQLTGGDGAAPVSFDPTDRLHFDSLPVSWVTRCFRALIERAQVSESTVGNSAGPSASPAASDGAA